ncbi:MAG TPA: chemotaxis protein CheW [Polyangiaceae bacterium]|nr:chemotaxis protein CheW [Polyangiaceae bacterium]
MAEERSLSVFDRRLAAAGQNGLREFLSFRLGADIHAVDLARIREIVSSPPLTEVPRAQSDIVGICSVRGLLVTVVDLRRRLHLPESPQTRLSRILLANTDSGEVIGLLVDEVRQVIRLAPSEIEITANVLGADLADHVLGVGRPDGEFIILLDLDSIVET